MSYGNSFRIYSTIGITHACCGKHLLLFSASSDYTPQWECDNGARQQRQHHQRLLSMTKTLSVQQQSAHRRCKHCALAVERRSQTFSPRRRPRFPGAHDGQNLISWRRSLPLPTNPVWWGSMHVVSNYRGNRSTNKHTHKHTHTHKPTDRTDYNTLRRSLLAHSVIKAAYFFSDTRCTLNCDTVVNVLYSTTMSIQCKVSRSEPECRTIQMFLLFCSGNWLLPRLTVYDLVPYYRNCQSWMKRPLQQHYNTIPLSHITSCAGGHHNMPPPLCDLDLWLFDLENGVRVTCDVDNLCANFSLPRPLCSRLRLHVRDRQTDRQTASTLNAPG